MKVNYGSCVPISTVDWHGHVSVVLFLRNCPFRCPYCQNHELLNGSGLTDISVLEAAIKKSRPFVSSLVLLGGEPLMQKQAVMHLSRFAKQNGLLVGVHTNGFYPQVLDEMIKEKLLDKIFIDIKAPLDDIEVYGRVTGCDTSQVRADPADAVRNVSESVLLVIRGGVELELRTTVFRGFMGDAADIGRIAASILSLTGDRQVHYVLQQGLAENAALESMRCIKPFSRDEMLELARSAHGSLENIWIRTREQGNEKLNFEPV
ncbi:anaerobic ribonucleoside-triphosphate reductase activating protein [Methanolobus chelungpuianus]|uniref:Radical activating enzyme n=1 Tax=Methanolobus chelungpuianus TaxID=502115 RepID=A0AAE3HBD9_9EURY|nr:anaerobic ribonucleoside-triphosphate reductase activating protein [Methanolobus chelungpuianus]MCQ6962698.1 radical activating enzyme [Methanolobus chelungpuianus]